MPGNPGERQPGHKPQFQKRSERRSHKELFKPLEFGEYNGWVNRPTWSVFTVMTSYYETYQAIERIADQRTSLAIKNFVIKTVDRWKQGKEKVHEEAAHTLVQDFLQNGVRRVEWTPVYDTLRGERKALGEVNALTSLTYQLLSQTDWQAVVKDAKYLTQADDMLRSWLEDKCFTWLESPDARAHTGSVGKFANTVLDIYFQAVDWKKVTDALKEK